MPFTGPSEDRLAIRELFGRYADASWRGDREEWISCFTGDGRWTSHLFDCKGHAEMRVEFDKLWADWDAVAFLAEIGSMEIDGNCAAVRSYAREVVKLTAGGVVKLAGSYEDTLVRQNGEWLFARRDYKMLFAEAPG